MGKLIIAFVLLFLVLCFAADTGYAKERKAIAQIYEHLYGRGFSVVTVERIHVGGREAYTFHVTYRDLEDVYCEVVCQVQAGVENAAVFWQEPIPASLFNEQVGGVETPPLSAKEQIISDLSRETRWLHTE